MVIGMEHEEIKKSAENAVKELLREAKLSPGSILVVGCSSSEIVGERIGKGSDPDAASAVYEGIKPVLDDAGVYLACQCCEHLNRAIVVEREALPKGSEICNAVPQLHAGGSFAVKCYGEFNDPVVVEHIKADAGIDIGDTLIGMHLKDVAVPVRIETKSIGKAHVVCARTRPKYIGGERAVYDPLLAGK
jgi:uncharacterized protein (TIGR01440 family)